MTSDPELTGVAETLLIPLYVRALESGRPDAVLRDERAAELVAQHPEAFARIGRIRMDDTDRATIVLRNREFDRRARDFLARHPGSVVVHIGCGLDQRFERVDDGHVEWYDLDLPEVIDLRRAILGEPHPRDHPLPCSVLEQTWMDTVRADPARPTLFMAEGVFMYLPEQDLRELFGHLRRRFPGSELVFDAFSPFLVRANNLRLRVSRTGIAARYRWGLARPRDVERWAEGLTLLDAWRPLEQPDPRLARVRWMRHVRPLAEVMGVFHYRLGDPSALGGT